jgi:hypothetical protein
MDLMEAMPKQALSVRNHLLFMRSSSGPLAIAEFRHRMSSSMDGGKLLVYLLPLRLYIAIEVRPTPTKIISQHHGAEQANLPKLFLSRM